jgi:hypothetical protein
MVSSIDLARYAKVQVHAYKNEYAKGKAEAPGIGVAAPVHWLNTWPAIRPSSESVQCFEMMSLKIEGARIL